MTKARAWETEETGEPGPTGAEAEDADKASGAKCFINPRSHRGAPQAQQDEASSGGARSGASSGGASGSGGASNSGGASGSGGASSSGGASKGLTAAVVMRIAALPTEAVPRAT